MTGGGWNFAPPLGRAKRKNRFARARKEGLTRAGIRVYPRADSGVGAARLINLLSGPRCDRLSLRETRGVGLIRSSLRRRIPPSLRSRSF